MNGAGASVTTGPQERPDAADGPMPGAARKVLVVDDSRVQRRILSATMRRAGYEVAEAGSGAEALDLLPGFAPDIVLSDWMMPGMSGPEFCQALRARGKDRYVYFILLTSRNDVTDVTRGLEAGADDFLSKPVNTQELRARIAAGERILRMERALTENNRLLASTLSKLQTLYDAVDRDLIEAKRLQQSLVRDRYRDFGPAQIALTLRPSGHVGGDLVGFFPITDSQIGIFAIDVAGHGVASALMTARIAGYLAGSNPGQNIAVTQDGAGGIRPRPPPDVAAALNRILLEELSGESYLTLLYAVADMANGRVDFVQAGHPHPLIIRADGTVAQVGGGGLPVGLIAGARYDSVSAGLAPGDRLLIMSDGITEVADPSGCQLSDAALNRLAARNARLAGPAFLEALIWDLGDYAQGDFSDDVSAVLFEFRDPPG